MRALWLVGSLVLASLGFSAGAFAGELKILDNEGLLRAEREIDSSGDVRVSLLGRAVTAAKVELTLKNIDGLAADQPGAWQSDGTYLFSGITAGTWSITLPGAGTKIKEVRISF